MPSTSDAGLLPAGTSNPHSHAVSHRAYLQASSHPLMVGIVGMINGLYRGSRYGVNQSKSRFALR
jgi:hypothetical protein